MAIQVTGRVRNHREIRRMLMAMAREFERRAQPTADATEQALDGLDEALRARTPVRTGTLAASARRLVVRLRDGRSALVLGSVGWRFGPGRARRQQGAVVERRTRILARLFRERRSMMLQRFRRTFGRAFGQLVRRTAARAGRGRLRVRRGRR